MAEIVEGRDPESVVFCGEEDQRQWLSDTLQHERMTLCPKKGRGRRAKDCLTLAKADETITVAQSSAYRASLSTGPIRRISTLKDVKKSKKK